MKILSITNFAVYILFLSLITLSVSCSGDDSVVEEEIQENQEKTLMSVEVNGEEFNGLKNIETQVGFTDLNTTLMTYVGDDIRFAWFQGTGSDFQISIYLSDDMWRTGTFPIDNRLWTLKRGAYVSYIVFADYYDDYYDIEGEITITKFDLVNKEFEASFNFSNNLVTANGTLDYELDNPEF